MTGLFTYRKFSLSDTPPLTGKVAVLTVSFFFFRTKIHDIFFTYFLALFLLLVFELIFFQGGQTGIGRGKTCITRSRGGYVTHVHIRLSLSLTSSRLVFSLIPFSNKEDVRFQRYKQRLLPSCLSTVYERSSFSVEASRNSARRWSTGVHGGILSNTTTSRD